VRLGSYNDVDWTGFALVVAGAPHQSAARASGVSGELQELFISRGKNELRSLRLGFTSHFQHRFPNANELQLKLTALELSPVEAVELLRRFYRHKQPSKQQRPSGKRAGSDACIPLHIFSPLCLTAGLADQSSNCGDNASRRLVYLALHFQLRLVLVRSSSKHFRQGRDHTCLPRQLTFGQEPLVFKAEQDAAQEGRTGRKDIARPAWKQSEKWYCPYTQFV
jgi:hypothetical protein